MAQGMHELVKSIADLHGQLYMVNHNIKSLYQTDFQKYAPSTISALAIIGSLFVAYKNSKWSYVNQKKIEKDKRDEEKIKQSQDNYKRIYSELSSKLFEFINKSILSDFEKLHYQYYRDLSYMYKKFEDKYRIELDQYKIQNAAIMNTPPYNRAVEQYTTLIDDYVSKVKESKSKTESSHKGMMEYSTIMIECFNEINKLAYEYEYLNEKSDAIKPIGEFTDCLNGFIGDNVFANEVQLSTQSNKVESSAFQNKRDAILNNNPNNYEEKLKPLLYRIQTIIKAETKAK